jgi:hypothetical protein
VATSSSRGRAIILLDTFTFIGTGKLVVKWDLDNKMPMKGEASRRVVDLINELESEGLL